MLHAIDERISVRRRFAVVFSLIVVSLVTLPIIQNFRKHPDDGFPLSYYPMFSKKRSDETQVAHPIGIRADGSTVNLDYRVAGRGGMNQVRRQIRKIIRHGDADELCRNIAKQVARSDRPPYRELQSVAIVTDTYRFSDFFRGDHKPHKRKVEARCVIERVGTR